MRNAECGIDFLFIPNSASLTDEGPGMKSSQPYVPESGASTQVPGTAAAGPKEMLPYIVPMLTFLVLTNLEGYLPGQGWYPPAYAAKVLIVALAAWSCRSTWADLRPVPPAPTWLLATMFG